MDRSRLVPVLGSVLAALVSTGTATAATSEATPTATHESTEQARTTESHVSLPPSGSWMPYTPKASAASAQQHRLVRPIPRPCPPGTSSYPPPNQVYNCMAVYSDNANTGHPVGLRQGFAGGFGYLHALVDHGVDEETIGTVIANNAYGALQPNGRYRYGLRFEVADVGIIAVEVYEQREPDPDFNDGHALGVVTAFCPGYDVCPPGVNESIP